MIHKQTPQAEEGTFTEFLVMIDDHDLPEDSDKDSDYNPSEESEDSLEYDSEAEDCLEGAADGGDVEE